MGSDNQDDKDLARRAAAGEVRAFHNLLDRHYTTMFRMAYRFCGHRENAEDITQMTCMKLAQSITQYRGESAFTTWLYTVVLNVYRDWLRSSGKKQRAESDIETAGAHLEDGENPEKKAMLSEQMERLKNLPEAEFEAVILVFAEGLSHKEAAVVLGCAESTVSWRIHEARKKLLSEEGGSHVAGRR